MSFPMTLGKFQISSMKSITLEWNHITMGYLWRLYWGAVHSLGQTAPHDFAIWNLGAELALAAYCLSSVLNILLFWSAFNLPCSLCCLLLYWESMGVYCATSCITNCLTMSLLNVVSLFLLYKMSFAFSISYINVSMALRSEWWNLKTIGYLGKFSYSQDKYRELGSPLKWLLREAFDPVLMV